MDEGLEAWAVAATKARYFRFMDVRRWDDCRSVFTDDARFEHPTIGKFDDIDAAIQAIQNRIGDLWSFHGGSIPEISIVSATEATGTFAMFSLAKPQGSDEMGRTFGHYYDDFRKVDGTWLISSMRLVSSYNAMPWPKTVR
jgi:hypothetical protein